MGTTISTTHVFKDEAMLNRLLVYFQAIQKVTTKKNWNPHSREAVRKVKEKPLPLQSQ